MAKYVAGQDIDHFCKRCDLELAHTVVAVGTNGLPAQVKCNTCHSYRKYRAPKEDASRPATVRRARGSARKGAEARATTAARRASSTVEKEQKWNALMRKARQEAREASPYSMAEQYKQGDVIAHQKFGSGVVERKVGEDKIVVCFEGGDRLLVHGRLWPQA